MPSIRRFQGLLGSLVLVALLGMAGQAACAAEEPLKVGFVYLTPIGDAGWTYQHDLGRIALEKNLGDKVETSFVESVPYGADAERVIRRFASSGYNLIFTTSHGYMNPTIKVAQRFPNIVFENATGYKRAKNVGTYLARFYEGRYLTGIVAGKMTKSNIVGYAAAHPTPSVVRGINAFTIGLRSVNPDAQVKVIWVNSWYDPPKEREAVETLIAQGADIVTHHTDSTAVVQTAEEKGVYAIGYHSDMSKFGPRAHLTATMHDWGDFYTRIAREVLAGTWTSSNVWGGIKEGMTLLAPFGPAVPNEVARLVEARKADIATGKLHPFQGPIRDQSGAVRVPAGEVMGEKALLALDWYVEGVVGKLPK